MSAIEILDTGLIYRNPKPHVRAIQALFPSVVHLNNGEMLAAVTLAEAFEAVNMHTYFCRSQDGGESWELEGQLYEGKLFISDAARICPINM